MKICICCFGLFNRPKQKESLIIKKKTKKKSPKIKYKRYKFFIYSISKQEKNNNIRKYKANKSIIFKFKFS